MSKTTKRLKYLSFLILHILHESGGVYSGLIISIGNLHLQTCEQQRVLGVDGDIAVDEGLENRNKRRKLAIGSYKNGNNPMDQPVSLGGT